MTEQVLDLNSNTDVLGPQVRATLVHGCGSLRRGRGGSRDTVFISTSLYIRGFSVVTVCQATLTTASAQGVLTEAGNLRFTAQTGHAGDVPHR